MHTEIRTLFSPDAGTYFINTYKIDSLTNEEKQAALSLIETFMSPMPRDKIAQLFLRLTLVSPSKEKEEIDTQLQCGFYVEDLAQYPADIVHSVMHESYKWFPSLHELKERCNDMYNERKRLLHAIQKAEIKQNMEITEEK